jgi:FkbM family methyltransferase
MIAPMKMPVLKRIVPSLRKHYARLMWPKGRGVVRREGVLYLLNLGSENWVDKNILLWGGLDPRQRAFLIQEMTRRQCDTFFDIGANFGTYAACVALQTHAGMIIAYEPDPRAYDRLLTHLLMNGLRDRVQTRRAAVSDRNGVVPFICGQGGNDSSSKVGEGGSTVPAVRLDDEWPLKSRRIALKIDVEGHEMAALDGMKTLLRDNDCFLQVECWNENAQPFIAGMGAIGYRTINRIDLDYYFARAD